MERPIFAVLGACTLAAAGPAQPAADPALLPYAEPGGRVDIGGRGIDLRCSGGGKGPVVVLMAGLGGFSSAWYKIQPAIAARTRVCAFDTAGYGYSDPPPRPQSLSDVTNDLHAVLAAAHVKAPYVLVAHSIAGVEARLYALRWPNEVAGMVLVDSSFAGQRLVMGTLPGFATLDVETGVAKSLQCIERLSAGPADGPGYDACVGKPGKDTPDALRAVWPKFYTAAGAANTVSLSFSLITPLYDEADHVPLGDRPLVVLTAGTTGPASSPAQADYLKAFRTIWLDRHEAFARLSSRGVHRVIEGSGHTIQVDRPEAVLKAIGDVLDQLEPAKATKGKAAK